VRTSDVPPGEAARLRHLARRKVIERVGRGVYRVAGAPETWQQRLSAATWSLGDESVASHRSAARLHGFELFDDDIVELTVPADMRGRRVAGATVHASPSIARRDVVVVDGFRATGPDRTIVDLARVGVSDRHLEAAVDSAIESRLTTLDRLIERVNTFHGPARKGVARLDAVLRDAGGHSYLERRFLELVRRAGLPRPLTQQRHTDEGAHVARVDFLFEEANLVVEVSGGRGHRTPRERANDARRRNRLQQLGRTVLEFTHADVTRNGPAVIETLLRSLDRTHL
jgi:very-short-patch-repair endonuclease